MDVYSALRAGLPQTFCERDFSFARHTTIGCGGVAAAAVYPADAEEIAKTLSFLLRENMPHCLLGAGANVLPAEGRFEGAVVRFSRAKTLFCDGTRIYAGAGVPLGALLRFARENDVGGFEPFTGIPATVGGATAMNAGIAVRHMCDLVERVVAVRAGKLEIFDWKDCAFSEKDSAFLKGIAVAGVYFKGVRSYREQILRESCYYRIKRAALPKGRSMGCVFVNPRGLSAGKLIEESGLKGTRIGGAVVARGHANFILNEGGTADDVARLVAFVKEEVKKKTGIELREEIKRIP